MLWPWIHLFAVFCALGCCDSQAPVSGEGGLSVGGSMNLVRMDKYDEAKCLDGSEAGYYHRTGMDGCVLHKCRVFGFSCGCIGRICRMKSAIRQCISTKLRSISL